MISLGVLLAVLAMLGWGFGDFFMQKSIRRIGIWETLFLVPVFGTIVLLPFVWNDLPALFSSWNLGLKYLIISCFSLLAAGLLNFYAFKIGKLSIVEPLLAIEIPTAGIVSFLLIGEKISIESILVILLLITGLVLVSIREKKWKFKGFEKGVFIAIGAGVLMGFANFMFGLSGRETGAIMTNWFTDTFLVIISAGMISLKRNWGRMWELARRKKKTIGAMMVFDRIAWLAFTQAMILAPIAIAVALSECYIVIAVLLGVFANKERLHKHQVIGIIIAIVAAILLAAIM